MEIKKDILANCVTVNLFVKCENDKCDGYNHKSGCDDKKRDDDNSCVVFNVYVDCDKK